MWLAFSDEMADPDSPNPIERESTRLRCVATAGGQASNGVDFWRKTVGSLLGAAQHFGSLLKPSGKEQDPVKVQIATWGAKMLEEANRIAALHSALDIVSADDPRSS